MRILIYEYVSGGGFLSSVIPADILSEGYGMLRCIISDLKRAGHEVTTIIDSRIAAFNPPLEADRIIAVSSIIRLEETLLEELRLSDAAYIIAPESSGILERLVRKAESTGKLTLNCKAEAIKVASDKTSVYKKLKGVGLMLPETITFRVDEDIRRVKREVKRLGFPLVFKPSSGVGCEGLSVVRHEGQVKKAVDKIRKESECKTFIVQRMILGTPTSVSLLSTGEGIMPLALNRQLVILRTPSSKSIYRGGITQFNHPLRDRAFKDACVALKSISGLVGYVGVDMVLTSNGPTIMEINPRLTTSYIGLTRIVNFNLAQALIDAVVERRLLKDIKISGTAIFLKVKVKPPSIKALPKIYEEEEILSPPFPLEGNKYACALIVTSANNLSDARTSFINAKMRLTEIIS